MPATLRDLMNETGVAFGTSGARGLVSAMTDRVCHAYTAGFLAHLAAVGEFAPGRQVAVAGDLRPSTPRILRACVQAILDAGGVPVNAGHVPTPALAHWAFARGIPSLMVTGSHIPDDRNGIKFHRARGEVLKADEAGMSGQPVPPADPARFDAAGALRTPPALPPVTDVTADYVARYTGFFGADALAGIRVGVYQHSAVGRDLLAAVLTALGAAVTPLARSDRFIPVDTEALRPEDVALAAGWAAGGAVDAIASTDGDSDRPLLADQHGRWLRGDILGLLCARALWADCVVTPVSSNTALEASGAFARTRRTRIGSPFVIAAMAEEAQQGGIVAGYEANGGFLLGSDIARGGAVLTALPTRDAVLPIVAVLAAARGTTVADLCAALPPRVTHSDRLKDFATARSQAIIAWLLAGTPAEAQARIAAALAPVAGTLEAIDTTDGLRMSFAGARVVHFRPSGNAPELRCYTEAATEAEAEALNRAALALVTGTLAAAAGV